MCSKDYFKINLYLSLALLLYLVLLFPTAVMAQSTTHGQPSPHPSSPDQETPYSPKTYKPHELFVSLDFEESPINLPFDYTRKETISHKGYNAFRYQVSLSYDEVTQYFLDAYNRGQSLPILDTKIAKFSDTPDIKVVGHSVLGQEHTFNLGTMRTPNHIQLIVTPASHQTSQVTILGLKGSSVFSGTMPARASFKPADANPIPFRWN